MRLPSLERLLSSSSAAVRRFPVVAALAGVATAAGLVLVQEPADEGLWVRFLVASTLGLPLTFAVTVAAERRRWRGWRRAAALGLALLVLAAVHLAWPGWEEEVAARRYVQLSAGFHLLAAFLPFVGVEEPRGFWQYNRALLLRFLTAGIYVVVLQAGLSLALGALDQLFGVPVPDRTYLRLWVVLALLFQTWFFLAGVPEDVRSLEAREDYPRGLELFTRHVLVPLVVVYLVILTAYAGKVLVTWDWPGGWIGWLVSAVGVVGILAYLLVHPIREEAGSGWIRAYGRWFWVTLLPSVALLALAVRQRIAQYGVTEDRYFLAVGAGWLGATALYYAISRSEDIERIPQSLCAVVLLTLVGPWSAYAVSERSQLGRLRELLAANEMLVDGRARPAAADVSFEDRREISAAVRYLVGRHGEGSLAPLFGGEPPAVPGDGEGEARPSEPGAAPPPEADAVEAGGRRAGGAETRTTPERIVASLGLDYVERWEATPGAARDGRYRLGSGEESAVRPVAGYRLLVRGVGSAGTDTVQVEAGLRLVADDAGVRLLRDGAAALELPVAPLARRLAGEARPGGGTVPADSLWVEASSDGLRAALWLAWITGRRDGAGDALEVTGWSGEVLVGEAPEE